MQPTLRNRRVLVTGANGGLGLATCRHLLAEGAHVVLACRTQAKADAARQQLLDDHHDAACRLTARGGFDMLAPEAIDTAVRSLEAPVDVVFLQAGGWVWADTPQVVHLGGHPVEATVAKNLVGAHATLRALLSHGRLGAGARVVLIGGEGARGVPGGIRKPSFEDLPSFRQMLAGKDDRPYVPVDALGAAKFCAALWVRHLATHSKELEVVWFSPGLIGGTGGTRGMPAWKEALFQRVAFPMMVALGKAQWPDAAAAKCVDCLAGRIGRHGDLLGAPEGTALGPLTDQGPMHERFADSAFQQAVWDLCVDAIGELPLSTPARHIA